MNGVQAALSSPRFGKILFWVSAAVLAGGLAVLIVKLADGGGSSSPAAESQGLQKIQLSQPGSAAKNRYSDLKYKQLSPRVRAVIRKFVLTAVARKNVAQSWPITTAELRQGASRREWASGNISLQYFPVYKFDRSNFAVVEATPREITVEMGLNATPKSGLRPTSFWIGVHRFGSGKKSSWRVDYFMPRWTPPFPEDQ